MLQVYIEILKNIIPKNADIEYEDCISKELLNKKIISVNNINFDEFIKNYADEHSLELLLNGYQYDGGFMSYNDLAIRNYTLYPNTIFLPLSDPLLGLISNFIDEYDSYESSTFVERSYEVFKLISLEMKEKAIIIFDVEE